MSQIKAQNTRHLWSPLQGKIRSKAISRINIQVYNQTWDKIEHLVWHQVDPQLTSLLYSQIIKSITRNKQ